MKNIIFLAPPAAGKGTQSNLLVEKYGYVHISTGELLRAGRNDGTERAKIICEFQDNGGLVPNEIVDELLKERLQKDDCKNGFILDGYPRTMDKLETLNKIFTELNITDVIAIYLNISEEEAMHRTLGRMNCPTCQKDYNKYYEKMKPAVEFVCDDCKTELSIRSDDNEETFKKRFQTYLSNTKPIMDYYKDNNLLKEVIVDKDSSLIFADIENILKEA